MREASTVRGRSATATREALLSATRASSEACATTETRHSQTLNNEMKAFFKNRHIVHLKYLTILFVNYTSIKQGRKIFDENIQRKPRLKPKTKSMRGI